MKAFGFVLVLLPLAFANPSKRFILGDILDSEQTNALVQQIVDTVGSDATEQQCETQCMAILNNALLDTACPFVCSSLQELAHRLDITPGSVPVGKRFFMDSLGLPQLEEIFSMADLHKYTNMIVDVVGSDATEQQCEAACLEVMANKVLDSSCPLLCSAFQVLVRKFHFEDVTPAPAKRFVADGFHFDLSALQALFSHDDIVKYLNQIVDLVGSDETEAKCEQACIDVFGNDILDKACGFICPSFQALVQHYHIQVPAAAAAPVNKRMLLGDIFDVNALMNALTSFDLDTIVNTIGDQLGSDFTEYKCEEACQDHTDLPDLLCPALCSSFQAIAQQIHITEANNGTSIN